jgi:hypothetical protein
MFATGTLTYVPNADQFGTTTITVTVEDGGTDDDLSTTDNNEFVSQTFTLTVSPVNDQPTLTPIADLTIAEDDPGQSITLSGVNAGGGETQPIRITAVSDNTNLIANPSVDFTSGNTTGTLQFAPVTDAFGQATITVTLEDGGVDGDLDTTFDNEIATETFVVAVTPVNDNPTLSPVGVQPIDEDSGEQSVGLSGITAGDAESDPLRVTAVSNDPSLIAIQGVSYTDGDSSASVLYTPQQDQFGTTSITVTVEDGGLDGDLATTNDNGSVQQTIQIVVNPVNDAPLIDAPANETIDEDSGQRVVSLTGILAGTG